MLRPTPGALSSRLLEERPAGLPSQLFMHGGRGPTLFSAVLFEAAALGVCLISEDHPNLCDLFEPGREILTYRSADELIERLRHALAHPEETAAIGERARRRALACHTYRARVTAVHALLQSLPEPRR